MKVVSLALNYVSRGSVVMRPIPVANGHLLRIDLRWYASQDADLHELLKIWEQFAFDPTFSLLITKDNIEFAKRAEQLFPVQEIIVQPEIIGPKRIETQIVDHKGGRYVYPDDSGRIHESLAAGVYTVDLEFTGSHTPADKERKRRSIDVEVLRFNATHIGNNELEQLQSLTGSLAPIVEYRYFLTRALTTIKDKGVFKEVFGGLYYDLRGIKKSKIKGATDLDLFFENLGIGNIKAGLKQEQLFNGLRSDERLAIFRSEITGKPREVSAFHTPAAKRGGSWGSITGDIKDADVDVGDRAFANLLTPKRQAREAIFPTRTGFNIFALFNGVGELQDEVPPDVAIDSTIPAPYTRRLQPAIGCIRCHQADGSDGWKPLTNDVAKLMDFKKHLDNKLNIFGDLSQGRKAFDADTIDRLVGLYEGDFSDNIRIARDDVARVTLQATGPFKKSQDQANISRLAAEALSKAFAEYNYELMTPQSALREMGLDVRKEKSVEIFNRLMAIDVIPATIFLEDVRIAALKANISILRADWALVYDQAMSRVQRNLKKESAK